jgi:hypothetical protein
MGIRESAWPGWAFVLRKRRGAGKIPIELDNAFNALAALAGEVEPECVQELDQRTCR